MRPERLRASLCAVALAAMALWQPIAVGQERAATVVVDLSVVDAAGRVPASITPEDLGVIIDGRPRTIAWVRRVSRGPGALADAAARRAAGSGETSYVAEPSRTVLIVIDEPSLPVGEERPAIQGAAALLDRLAMRDRVAVIRLPMPTSAVPDVSADRPLHRQAVNRIAGRMPPEGMRADGITPDAAHIDGNPMGARINREERPERPDPVAGSNDVPSGAGGIEGLIRVLRASAGLPGRKVVAFYSSGLDDQASGRIAAAARAAAEARAALVVFAVPVPRDPRFSPLDSRLLTRLATATGGVFVRIGRNPSRDLEPITAELDACLQVGLSPDPDDAAGGVRSLRVEARREGLIVRAPSFVATRAPATDDVEPAAPRPAEPEPAAPAPDVYRGRGRLTGLPPSPQGASTADPELNRILGRLIDYTQAYVGQYSALVAEEEYRQFLPLERRGRRLRSDLLFVRSESAKEWVSFRDVYEVDGKPVRDRDSRLQDLFLTPRPGGRAQLLAIKEESARYNIGSFERNINVPLFPLKILNPEQRKGFTFSSARASETAGVKTWRLAYREIARPSLVRDRDGEDVPLQGHFVIEQATGAIVETAVSVEQQDYSVSIEVRYARHDTLGMWLPAEMKETYRVSAWTASGGRIALEGTARYSNFRRFQVTTDLEVAPKK